MGSIVIFLVMGNAGFLSSTVLHIPVIDASLRLRGSGLGDDPENV